MYSQTVIFVKITDWFISHFLALPKGENIIIQVWKVFFSPRSDAIKEIFLVP